MNITFLAPGYPWAPSGGMRVVYEYANMLVARDHEVSIVHPRRLAFVPRPEQVAIKAWARQKARYLLGRLRSRPLIDWQPIDSRVRLLFVPNSSSGNIPDADVIFATSCHTVPSVLQYPHAKGEKAYLIQGYESFHAPKKFVDATWRAPLRKIVVAKWLADLAVKLGCEQVTYIPNALRHERYRLKAPIAGRKRQLSMMFSTAEIKGAADGIEALRIVRDEYPDIRIVFFGVSRPQPWIPAWAEYHRNPPQDFIVDEIYNKSQIFVSASWIEGFALPPAEAAACGCAIATTDSLGVREFIEHGITGLLSSPKDPKALAKNICLLLESEPLRYRIATACNSFVSRLNWDRSTSLFERFLASVPRHDTAIISDFDAAGRKRPGA